MRYLKKRARSLDLGAADELVAAGEIDWVTKHIAPKLTKDECWRASMWLDEAEIMSEDSRRILQQMKDEPRSGKCRVRPPLKTFEEAITTIQSTNLIVYDLRRLAKDLSEEQVRTVAELWLQEENWRRALNYGRLFKDREFPLPVAEIINRVREGKPPAKFEDVLSYVPDPAVRELGFQLIERDAPDYRGYLCLASSYEDEDLDRMLRNLDRFKGIDLDDLHSLVIDLKQLTEEMTATERLPFLVWSYENGPCSFCRGVTAEIMAKDGTLPDSYRLELPYDADELARTAATIAPKE